MGFKLIFAGLIFFFNPNIGLFDFVPDLFGCILIIMGLSKLKYTDDRFDSANRAVLWLTCVEVVKLCLLVYSLNSTSDELPYVFIFSVLETVLLFWFFCSFFAATDYALTRHCDIVSFSSAKSAGVFTPVFVGLKGILTFVPYGLSLWNTYDEQGRIIEEPLRMIKPYVILLCFVAVLALGICFVVVIKNYFCVMTKSKQFINALYDIYKINFLDNTHLVNKRRFNNAISFIILGSIFIPDFTVDGINLLPDTVGYIFIIIGIALFNGHTKKNTACLYIPIISAVYSVFTYYFKTLLNIACNNAFGIDSFFSKKYEFVANGNAIYTGSILAAIQSILYVATIFIICKVIVSYLRTLEKQVSLYSGGTKLKITCIVNAISSAVVYALPAVTAFYHYKAQNYVGHEKYYEILAVAEACDTAVMVFGVIFLASNLYTIYTVYKIKKTFNYQY